ncbi:class I SAM-dependent methyltransferase [Candidatus Symbiobacter mobilis]|uniref:Methyltransferase type 11 domain-containing protein n=1 Tax=Candidatus Symbiobacter mobilis CR TaxID=946483 RepID=U5NA35_9BURK|nr:class I SAM-dependent methyltransferase [Candidatus Symbiobacter mobilis]AGX88396.1 hypothetical protein Cenrod_2335 [Candidatus Symbiobacter mobilis CR]
MQCGVCGGSDFTLWYVLWDQLIKDWQLSPTEAEYLNRQQGTFCDRCCTNIRSMVLANALRSALGTKELLYGAILAGLTKDVAILEINEAGRLTPFLQMFGQYTFGAYPEVDMHALPYPDNTFDVVIHSDTLEHVPNPIHALAECRRVLKPEGTLCFTVPIVVGRMSRSRIGLPHSYHGNATTVSEDLVVVTEFGADVWTYVIEAGFTEVTLHTLSYPAGIAVMARGRRE